MRTYYFFRHGKADPMVSDLYKPLTEDGIIKVTQQAAMLKDSSFDLVICSNALRTEQTADILLQDTNPLRIISDQLCHPLDKALRQHIDTLVSNIAGNCLADYLSHDPNNYYMHYAQIVSDEILAACNSQKAQCILIVGHAIIINAVASILAPKQKKALAHLALKTSEGFAITPEQDKAPQLFLQPES
jgi:phosphohistidine phosphatase SixA